MRHEVFIQSGSQKGFRIPISTRKPTLIGRASDCDLRLLDEGVSRRHCRLEPVENGVQLVDLGSHNGTRVNGELAKTVQLRHGDLIALGNCVLRYGVLSHPSELLARRVEALPPLPIPVDEMVTADGSFGDISPADLEALESSDQIDTELQSLLSVTLADESIPDMSGAWDVRSDGSLGPGDPPPYGVITSVDALGRDERRTPPSKLLLSDDITLHTSLRRRFDGARALGGSDSELHERGESARLAAVYEAARLIHGERDLDVILDKAAETILQVTNADRVAVLLIHPESSELEPAATRVSATGRATGEEFRVSRTIVVEPMQGVSVISSDAAIDDRFREGESVLMQQVRSVMCVPLQSRNLVIGVLYVDSVSYATVFKETDLALLAAIGQQVGVAIERTRLMNDLEHLFVGAMLAITASIEAKDPYTRGHSERVTLYALMLADTLEVPQHVRDVVELGALLHDVGKIGIPERVLCKPGALDDSEFAIMKQHPVLGAKIVGNMPELERIVDMKGVIHAVRHHHEKYDGSGYPDGLAGKEISVPARILTIADAYDALVTDRPYRGGCGKETALSVLLANAGRQFDPAMVDAFCAMMTADEPPTATAMRSRFRVTQFHRSEANG